MFRVILVSTVLAVIGACAGSGVVVLTNQDMISTYSGGEFRYAVEGGELRVVVVGNPFGGDQAAFERAVTDAMRGRHWGPPVRFTTDPGPGAREAYRVVMVFNPPTTLIGERVCRGNPEEISPKAPEADETALFAVFCLSDGFLTQVQGTVRGATGFDDRSFRELVGQATQALFPKKQRVRRVAK